MSTPPAPGISEGSATEQTVSGMFGRDSAYMLAWGLQVAAAAGLTPVFTRIMRPNEYGGVASANAVMQVLFVVAGIGLQTAIQRHYAAKDGQVDAARLLSLNIVLAFIVTAVVDATGQWWGTALGFASYDGPLRLAVLWAGASAVTASALALLRSQDRLLAFSCVSLVQSVVAESASLVLVLTVRPTATVFLLGQLLAQCAAIVLALSLCPPRLLRWQDRGLARAALVFAIPLVPAMLSEFVLSAADRIILQSQLGQTAVARYQIAYNIGDAPMLLLGVLNTVWMPRIFAIGKGSDLADVLAASRDALYRVLVPVVIGLAAGAPLVLRLWAPADYRPDELLLVNAVVIICVVPLSAGLAATRALLSAGKTGTIAGAAALAACLNVLLNFALIPHLELAGAALATFCSFVLLHVLLQLRARFVAPTRRTSPRRLLLLALTCVIALLASLIPVTAGFVVMRAIVGVAALGWFIWVLRQLSAAKPSPTIRRTAP
jgi:O-antigen/teichoic acid export membrane protein